MAKKTTAELRAEYFDLRVAGEKAKIMIEAATSNRRQLERWIAVMEVEIK